MKSFQTSDGLRIRYRIDDFTDPWRPAETLVLLHAAQGSGRRFFAWVPHLARRFRVVRPDLRGHGGSGLPPAAQPLTIERLVQDVVELCDHLGCDRVHLAGSSAGAMIAMRAAIDHPERVLSFAAFAAIAGMKGAAFDVDAWIAAVRGKGIRRFLADSLWHRFDLERTDPGLIEWWLDLAAEDNPDPEYAARFIALMRSLDLRPDLARITCPALVVVPGDDSEHPLAEYEVLRDGLPDVRFIVLDARAHNITDALADRCAVELHAFLAGLRRGADRPACGP
jgi:3-oxoadipate enol-lactonase